MITRTGDMISGDKIFNQLRRLEEQVERQQIQVSTGERASKYSEIAKESNQLILAENAFMKTNQYLNGIKDVRLRTSVMDSTMSEIVDLATEFRSLLLSATSSENYNEFDVEGNAKDLMDRLVNLLNTKADGKYVFSGTATNVQPVALEDPLGVPTNTSITPGEFTPYDRTDDTTDPAQYGLYFDYYNGNTGGQQVRVSEDQVIEYGVSADEEGFVDLMYAMRIAATFQDGSVPQDEKLARLNEALDLTIQGQGKIIDRQSELGQKLKVMDEAKIGHEETIFLLEETIVEIESTNIPQTLTRLSETQTQLEASYLLLTRLQSTSLINFLN